MAETPDRRIKLTIDFKKNRLRIHRPALRMLGFPPFIKLLFSTEHNAVAVIRCEKGEIPRINDIRVTFDPHDDRHTFDIYSKDLILTIRLAFRGLDQNGLYILNGYSVPDEEGIYFPLSTMTFMEDRDVQITSDR